MAKVTSKDGTRIAYDRTGEGPTVILVESLTGYRDYFGGRLKRLTPELSRTFTVVNYDRRGRGESGDTQPYAVAREVEDLEALIDEVGAPACLYGLSSGAALVLKTAAALGNKVAKLALYEPPFHSGDESAKQASLRDTRRLKELLAADRRGEAVAFVLADMMPPETLEALQQSPEWPLMEAVAPTFAYDFAVLGDGSPPLETAKTVAAPTLILNGSAGLEFIGEALGALANAMPKAERRTLEGQTHGPSPEALAPVLTAFFTA